MLINWGFLGPQAATFSQGIIVSWQKSPFLHKVEETLILVSFLGTVWLSFSKFSCDLVLNDFLDGMFYDFGGKSLGKSIMFLMFWGVSFGGASFHMFWIIRRHCRRVNPLFSLSTIVLLIITRICLFSL